MRRRANKDEQVGRSSCPYCRLKMYCERHKDRPMEKISHVASSDAMDRLYDDLVTSRLQRYQRVEKGEGKTYWKNFLEDSQKEEVMNKEKKKPERSAKQTKKKRRKQTSRSVTPSDSSSSSSSSSSSEEERRRKRRKKHDRKKNKKHKKRRVRNSTTSSSDADQVTRRAKHSLTDPHTAESTG